MSLVSRVLPDANVFFSRTLTDWISLPRAMSTPPIYEVCWTEDILAEARYLLDDSAPTVIRDVTHVQQTYFERTRERFSLPRMLESAGAPEFAERVREHLQHI